MEERLTLLQAKLEADPSLGEKLFSLETAEEVQGFLRELELEFSIEEINMLRDEMVEILAKTKNGELSDEDLEEVAGGFVGAAILIIGLGILAEGCIAGIVHVGTKGRW